MPVPAENRWHTDEQGIARLIPAVAPAPEDQPALLDWALAAAAAAEQRIADLEERLAYLEGLSVTDELTAVLNRRGFGLELTRALAAAARGGPRGVVIVCDLDGFKAVNDLYGHRSGNEVLRQVADALRRRVRKNDVAARLGGDEFALLLIGASLANARRKCVSLARSLSTSPPQVDGAPILLSASFGLAQYDGSEDPEALLHRADMEMYGQKRAGRETQGVILAR
ncbi:MAG TPA: GGDEF domain-containing protein [Stellaceae bacterium]|nr:GGDEF domain-containing protein [Stellaceae bacterium]